MNIQTSFTPNQPTLYVVATPIGNLDEITPRAINILSTVDVIYCEDTRVSLKLLNHLGLKKPLIACHKYNEKDMVNPILEQLMQGKSVALISDAGYPLISDPGYPIVNHIVQHGYPVVPISGPSAFVDALVCSGFNTQRFQFYGFLPVKSEERQQVLLNLQNYPAPIIFYEAPHRLVGTLASLQMYFPEVNCLVAKELTKLHEQFFRGRVSELHEYFINQTSIKGEYVIILEHTTLNQTTSVTDEMVIAEVWNLVKTQNYKMKQAIDIVATKYKISKNNLYNKVHKKAEGNENE